MTLDGAKGAAFTFRAALNVHKSLPKCMYSEITSMITGVYQSNCQVRCIHVDDSVVEIRVRSLNRIIAYPWLDFHHHIVEIPVILSTAKEELLDRMNREIVNVVFRIQVSDRVLVHLYGSDDDVLGARITVYAIAGCLLSSGLSVLDGHVSSREIACSGSTPISLTRIDGCRMLIIGDCDISPFVSSAPPIVSKLEFDGFRGRYVFYYFRDRIEDLLALYESYLETNPEIILRSFDPLDNKNCIRGLADIFYEVATVRSTSSVPVSPRTMLFEGDGVTTFVGTVDDLIKMFRDVKDEVVISLCISPDFRDSLLNLKIAKLSRIVEKVRCSAELKSDPFGFTLEISGSGCAATEAAHLIVQEVPTQICFNVEERLHKRLIGHGGRNIQRAMRKHNVYIRFMSESERIDEGVTGNVIVRTSLRNKPSLERMKEDILGKKSIPPELTMISLLDFHGMARRVAGFLFLYDSVVVFNESNAMRYSRADASAPESPVAKVGGCTFVRSFNPAAEGSITALSWVEEGGAPAGDGLKKEEVGDGSPGSTIVKSNTQKYDDPGDAAM